MFSSFLTLQCCHMTQWQIRRGLLRQEKSPSSEILVNQWVTHKQAFWQLTSANIVLPPGETSGAFSSLKGSISRAHPSSLGSCEKAGCYTTVLVIKNHFFRNCWAVRLSLMCYGLFIITTLEHAYEYALHIHYIIWGKPLGFPKAALHSTKLG